MQCGRILKKHLLFLGKVCYIDVEMAGALLRNLAVKDGGVSYE